MKTANKFILDKKREYKELRDTFDKYKKDGRKIPKKLLIGMKDIGREARIFFVRRDWAFIEQNNLEKKVFVIEKLQKYCADNKDKLVYPGAWKEGDIEFRIGYYIVGRIGNANGKWVWGQFCPLVPDKDINNLIQGLRKLHN